MGGKRHRHVRRHRTHHPHSGLLITVPGQTVAGLPSVMQL